MNTLTSKFPTASLALLPTPVRPLPAIDENLYMKEDSLSGPIYGGNKIRKLEFLLGEALSEGRKSIITYGAAGSNHALATAICCRELGLRAISILAPQQTSAHTRKNLLMQHAVGAELHLCPDFNHFPALTQQLCIRCRQEDGMEPYIIPSGGTNAIGALGFVNAALEMAEQIQPDVIYIPMGTGGTLAGLLVGLRLAGIDTRIEAIRVVDPAFRNESHVKKLCDELGEKLVSSLRQRDTENENPEYSEPLCLCDEKSLIIEASDMIIRNEFFGEDYGIPTPEGQDAVEFFKEREGVYLENTYTGKTAAALLHDLRSGKLNGQTVLYWNTLNARNFSADIAGIDFHTLPPAFHTYF